MTQTPEAPPYSRSLATSFAAHAALLALLFFLPQVLGWLTSAPPAPIEIEITSPFLGDGPAKLGCTLPSRAAYRSASVLGGQADCDQAVQTGRRGHRQQARPYCLCGHEHRHILSGCQCLTAQGAVNCSAQKSRVTKR